MSKLILFLTIICILSFRVSEPVVVREEALKAFQFLNEVRSQPGKHEATFPFLKDIPPSTKLFWNDTLAKVAEARALDMAKRKYFGHVDPDGFGVNHYIHQAGYKLPAEWIAEKNANYFESLSAGSTSGINAITNLLIDARTPSLGHRKHLLGLTEWDSTLVDIGIGYVNSPGSAFPSYACVIIAKRNW